MFKFLIKKTKNEDGAVLITSLLFLMIVTVISIIGIQSPKTDMMISGNEKLSVQAQQLANLGVMEAKNWLTVRYKPDAIPLNAKGETGTGSKYFIVARPDNALDTNFSRMGLLNNDALTINFTTGDGGTVTSLNTFNIPSTTPASGTVTTTTSKSTMKDSSGNDIATYEWNIVRLTDGGAIADANTQELSSTDVDLYAAGLGNAINDNFKTLTPISEGYNAALDEDKAFWQHFYISSKSNSNGLIAQSEGVASYKQIIPAR